MVVTVVCDVLGPENNGTTIAAMNLIRSMKERGHEVRVLCPDRDRKGQEGFFIVPTLNVGPFNGYVRKNGFTLARADKGVIRAALEGADVVHVMVPFALGSAAKKEAVRMGIPVTAGFHAMAENVTVHLKMKNSALAREITYRCFARFYRDVDAIHYPTQFLRDLFEKRCGPTNGYVISNGVNEQICRIPEQKPEEYRDRFVILFTGRYCGEKSHPVLIDAADRSKYRERIQLIFAGNGPLKDKLTAYARKLPNGPVFRFFSREEMNRLLNYADLYVHPAEIEAEGIGCLEAIACGLVPVIADSPRCATKDYAIDDRNLFRVNDPDDLAAKIDYWIEHPEEKGRCSREYLAYAKGAFSLSACMDRMEAMLLETVENRRKKDK